MLTSDTHTAHPARDWFAEASRCYGEEHQGCPACREQHCVFRARWGHRVEYHCSACDFSAAHDESTGGYTVAAGGEPGAPAIFGES